MHRVTKESLPELLNTSHQTNAESIRLSVIPEDRSSASVTCHQTTLQSRNNVVEALELFPDEPLDAWVFGDVLFCSIG